MDALQRPARADGEPRRDTFVDAVSVSVDRLGLEIGPSTPVVGRFRGEDFPATDPVALVRARSRFGLSAWRFEARDYGRRILGEVDAPRETLTSVAYPDPDGRPGVLLQQRGRVDAALGMGPHGPRAVRMRTLCATRCRADGRAHFEYGRRQPVAGIDLLL